MREMNYEEFLNFLGNVDRANFAALKDGYNACEACLHFNVLLREIVGVMKFKIEFNKRARKEDEEVMTAYNAQQMIIVSIAVKLGLCSHLKKIIKVSELEKAKGYAEIKEMIDAQGKEDA